MPENFVSIMAMAISWPVSRRTIRQPAGHCSLTSLTRLRCDRQTPCQTCSSRGLSLACSYTHNSHHGPVQPHSTRPSVQDRLVQLEQLVMNVIQNQNVPQSSAPTPLATDPHIGVPQPSADELVGAPTAASTPSDNGSLWYNANESRYVGGAHWTAILDGIADLREDVDQQGHGVPSSHPRLLYGCQPISRDAILATLPSRPTVDRGISRYFNLLDLAPCE